MIQAILFLLFLMFVLIVNGLGALVPIIILVVFLGAIYQSIRISREKERTEKKEVERRSQLLNDYGALDVHEIILNKEIYVLDKFFLLSTVYKYTSDEISELLKEAEKSETKAKLSKVRRDIRRKAQELYSEIPSDDERTPIPDDVKQFVWQRDKGRCVQCASNEKLEFDHIIPFSKGGSNTARNLQLLCETCNREKSDKI